jgi:hypothetical protein
MRRETSRANVADEERNFSGKCRSSRANVADEERKFSGKCRSSRANVDLLGQM